MDHIASVYGALHWELYLREFTSKSAYIQVFYIRIQQNHIEILIVTILANLSLKEYRRK